MQMDTHFVQCNKVVLHELLPVNGDFQLCPPLNDVSAHRKSQLGNKLVSLYSTSRRVLISYRLQELLPLNGKLRLSCQLNDNPCKTRKNRLGPSQNNTSLSGLNQYAE